MEKTIFILLYFCINLTNLVNTKKNKHKGELNL